MLEGNHSSLARPKTRLDQVESLEERQWRLLMEQARVRIAQEEAEWKQLLERARGALQNEEREWERLRTKADLQTSGAFPAHSDWRSLRTDSVAPARTASAQRSVGTNDVASLKASSAQRFARAPESALRPVISLWP